MERYIKRYAILLLLPLFWLQGCVTDTGAGAITPGDDISVKLEVRLPSDSRGAGTRSLTTAQEDAVETIDIFHFVDYNSDEKYYGVKSAAIQGTFTDGPPSWINATLETYPGRNSRLVFVVNARDNDDYGYHKQMELDDFLAALVLEETGEWYTGTARAMPMYAITGDVDIRKELNGTTLTDNGNPYGLIRMHAKFNISLAAAVTNFQLTSVMVYNQNTKGYIAYDENKWDKSTPTAPLATDPHIPASPGNFIPATSIHMAGTISSDTDNYGKIINRQYVFEVRNDNITDRLDKTALIIGGIYDANANGDFTDDGPATYYRVDIDVTDTNILRNYLYDVVVSRVLNAGYGTEEEAFIGGNRLSATITHWNLAGNSAIYGQYTFSVSDDQITFGSSAGSFTVTAKTNYNRTDEGLPTGVNVGVITFYPAVNAGEEWLTVTGGADGDLSRELILAVGENTGDARTAKVNITAGNFTKVINVEQSGY